MTKTMQTTKTTSTTRPQHHFLARAALFVLATSLLLLGLVACGDDDGDGTGQPDAAPDPDHATVFVVAGEFSSGNGIASTIGLPSLAIKTNVVAGVASSDPVLRHAGDSLFIVNRFGHDNITILDAGTGMLDTQISTGAGSNPQDVAVKGDLLYVAALNAPGILVIDRASPTQIDTIDLSALDEVDGIPDCNSVMLVGDTLFATCGLLDNFVPAGPGKVVVIDTTDNSLTTSFDMATANPVGFLQATPADSMLQGDLLVATVDFGAGLTTGCLERIGVGSTPMSEGCLVTNADLGGYASGHAYDPAEEAIIVTVTTGFGDTGAAATALRYDVEAGMLDEAPLSPSAQRLFEVVRCPTGEWVYADAAGGIRVYGADQKELTKELLDIGLPPVGKGITCY